MTINFRDALKKRMAEQPTSLRGVAEKSGVSYEQLKKLIQRPEAKTNVDDAVKVANSFGLTLDEFLQDDLASDRIEIAKIYQKLSEQELSLLRDLSRGRSGSE